MSNTLKFKYGSYTNLCNADGSINSNVPYEQGTVYITTDERAMFVDLNNQRIRMEGSVQYYESVETFSANTTPPYSTNTLYFFEKINSGDAKATNALMAYNGESWSQINVTLDAFVALDGKVTSIESSTTTLSNALNQLTQRVETIEGNIQSQSSRIDGLDSRLGTAEGNIGTLQTDLEVAENTISEHTQTIGTNSSNITTMGNRLATAEGEIDTLQNELNIAKNDIITANSNIDTNTKDIADLKEAIGSSTDENSLAARMSTAESDIDTLQSNVTTISEKNNSQDTEIESLKDRVGTSESEINTIKEQVDSLDSRVSAAEGDIDTVEGQVSDLDDRMGKAESAINTLNSGKADTSYVDTQVSDLKTELSKNLDDSIRAANAMTFMGTITSESELGEKTNVRVGDTWVLKEGEADITGTTVGASAGDFFIASGTEDDETGYITGEIIWNHVKSGYDNAFDPYQISTVVNSDNSAELPVYGYIETALKNFAGAELSKIKIATVSNNIEVTGTVDNTGKTATLNIGLVWDTF